MEATEDHGPEPDASDVSGSMELEDLEVRKTGRGFLVIAGAKGWFFVAAALLNFGLPALFASQAEYGVYGVVVNAVSLLNMVVIAGSLQAVSKLVSEEPSAARRVTFRALGYQLFIGLPIAVAWFLLADPLASWLRDPGYADLFRVSAGIVAAYSFYAVFVGAFNGLKAFTRQAALDVIFATLRAAAILGVVALGWGVFGAMTAFAAAAGVIVVLAGVWFIRWSRKLSENKETSVDGRRLLGFLFSIMVFTFVLNAAMRVDLFLLKRLSAESLSGLADPAAASNALAGAYNLALNAARIPYQASIALAFVIFPMISRTTFESDSETTKRYVTNTMRYSLMIVGGLSAVLAGGGLDLIRPVYPGYAYAGNALLLLCIAYALFALFYVATTILIAGGRPWTATLITLCATVIMGVLCHWWIGAATPGPLMLSAAARGVLLGTGIGLGLAGITIWQSYGAIVSWRNGLRLVLITAVVVAVGYFTSFERFVDFHDPLPLLSPGGVGEAGTTMMGSRGAWLWYGVLKAAGLGGLYLALLAISGEIGPDDRRRLRAVIGGRRARKGNAPPPKAG